MLTFIHLRVDKVQGSGAGRGVQMLLQVRRQVGDMRVVAPQPVLQYD